MTFLEEPPLWAIFTLATLGVSVGAYGAYQIYRQPREAWSFVLARFSVRSQFGLGLTVALGIVGVLFWAFAEVADAWMEQEDLYALDGEARDMATSFASPALTTFMEWTTALGSVWVAVGITLVLAVVLAYRKHLWAVFALGLVMGPGEGLVYALKFFFERVRPMDKLVHAGGYSFPSGHSFTAAALYGFIIYLLWSRHLSTRHLGRGLRIAVTVVLALVILGVGVSRIYLRVHYFTDVVGGFALAAGWLLAVMTLVRLFRNTEG